MRALLIAALLMSTTAQAQVLDPKTNLFIVQSAKDQAIVDKVATLAVYQVDCDGIVSAATAYQGKQTLSLFGMKVITDAAERVRATQKEMGRDAFCYAVRKAYIGRGLID